MSDGTKFIYVNVERSLQEKQIVYIDDRRDLNPGVLEDLLSGDATIVRDPTPLVETVWQAIWHATKEEPKQCLMTFVEIFILKFLSDNLRSSILPDSYSFYELNNYDSAAFENRYGKTQIEYYVQDIRPKIKSIFTEKTLIHDVAILNLFGLSTIVSPTSVINGFAFLQSGTTSLKTFNRTFMQILDYFQVFGTLSKIDPEFKLRLYETFLKKSVRQAKLGQFFTPRNVVRSMIKMARLDKLPEGSIVLDPAAGVGGFILEPLIEPNALKGNVSFANGLAKQRVRLIGMDVDENTNILAKANTLLHLAEAVRDPQVTPSGLNQLMADMFLVFNSNHHLGTLEYPISGKVDVVLTNPPYVTQGSRIYKDEIAKLIGFRNGFDLRDYYDRTGLGLEALFLRYISGALKPGGLAFVIVPQGLLTRTEKTTKEKLLSECNLIASISLPSNTFFNTPQKTFLLVFQKRQTEYDNRPDVFSAITSSIGETLDARRVPTPNDNTLDSIATSFVEHIEGRCIPDNYKDRIRIISATEFSASDRWDVQRFWNDDELVNLGAREAAVDRSSFIDAANIQLIQIYEDFQAVKEELAKLGSGPTNSISISNMEHFKVRRGTRVTRTNGDDNPGEIPVYSGSKDPKRPLCCISEEWAIEKNIPIENSPIITVNANGFVGACFVRREKCIIHDDVMIIEVINQDLDLEYVMQSLKSAIATGNFEYEAKLYNRVKDLEIEVPIIEKDKFDLARQTAIADVLKRFDSLRQTLTELGKWSNDSRIGDYTSSSN